MKMKPTQLEKPYQIVKKEVILYFVVCAGAVSQNKIIKKLRAKTGS